MLRAHLGLGSNLGDRWALLGRAIERLAALDPDLVVSPIYETTPIGGPVGQGPYLNAVVRLFLDLEPAGVLSLAAALEAEAGRVRAERWGPRTLDVDVLVLEAPGHAGLELVRVDTSVLTVPHPRWAERAFVVAPLADCSPELVPADWPERFGGAAGVEELVRRVGEIVRTPAP
jgi:2-amino-4-hydroxy-6-hydroxymethyldihydropteridine diphosphokinase